MGLLLNGGSFLNNSPPYHGGRFLKNVLIFEKKGGADFFPGLYGGLYGQNLPYKFKNRMVIFRIATSKNHIELLVPGQI
jgi:hypothetical protein